MNWNYPTGNTDIIATPSSTVVNGVTITTSATATPGKFTTNSALIIPASSSNGSSVGIIQMAMDATIDDETAYQTTTVRFSEKVYNVSFTLVDIDGGPTFSSLWNDTLEFNSDGGRPSGVVVNGTWVSYSSATGRANAISNLNAATGNANQTFGNITVTFPGPITYFTVRHYASVVENTGAFGNETDPVQQVVFIDDVTFTRSARLAVQKTSTGGTGTFTFNINNGLTFTAPSTYTYGTTSHSVTTTTAGVSVVGPSNVLGSVNTLTTLTETGPAGWELSGTSATCTDSNFAVSGNPSSFSATISGQVVTVAATNVKAGAVITCSFTNLKLVPSMTVDKVANASGPVGVGNVIGYTYTVTNTGNVTINNVTISDSHNGLGSDPVAWSEILLTDNGTTGDSTDAATDGSWDVLAPGDVIRFSSSYNVVQADIDNLQ